MHFWGKFLGDLIIREEALVPLAPLGRTAGWGCYQELQIISFFFFFFFFDFLIF